MLGQGYAVGSINGRLSTIRTYAKLAAKAGAIEPQEAALIGSVQGYANKEVKRVDAERKAEGIDTRKSTKKAEAVIIPADIAEAMATGQADTPQGRRDALLMCLLLEHGLRVGEVAILTRKAFDMKAGTFTFDRPKVNKIQTHSMTANTREAARAYLPHAPADGIIWRRTCKGSGQLSSQLSETSATRALTKRVELLGRGHGLESLSAHDCRHHWATYEAAHNTPINRLRDAGGWNSPAMPMRYIAAAKIANEGTARVKAA
jgi:integrase